MDAKRWQHVQVIFHDVVDLTGTTRDARLETLCAGDLELQRDVEAMLVGDAAASSLLDRRTAEVAGLVMRPDAPLPLSAQQIGPYRLQRVIGEGGMGVVYLAERDDLHSVAAIKLLRDAWLSPDRRARFVGEQQMLAQLNHTAIARLFDAGALADGTPWIAMEYVEGTTLHAHCVQRAAPLAARMTLLREVCEAVAHAHAHLVVHRDLKPGNVMVRDDGTVKLLDFGIAKQLVEHDGPDQGGPDQHAHPAANPNATRTRLLTPAYAAPEQVRGEAATVRTDVYALGVMLSQLLTDALPFDGTAMSAGELEQAILHDAPTRPSQKSRIAAIRASEREWDELDLICQTAMHKDPARRYRSVDALARDLEHFRRREPLDAHADDVRYRLSKFVQRHRAAVFSTSVATAALLMLVTFYTVRLAQARDVALSESVRAQRIQQFMTSLFEGGDKDAGPADSLRVVTLLDRGVANARALNNEPAEQADLLLTLGRLYRQLGRFDHADTLLRAGVTRWTALEGANSVNAARGRVALGELRTDQARYDDAERELRGGISTLRDAGAAEASRLAANVALGRSLTERGDYPRAIGALDSTVVALSPRAVDSTVLLDGLGALASAHFYAGHYDAADSLNRRLLDVTRRVFGDRHPRVAEVLMNLGATEQERGNYSASEQYFRDALARTTAFYGENHFQTAGSLVNLGRALLLQNRYAEAQDAFVKSLAIRERVYGPMHPAVANTLNEIGSLGIRESRYDDAAQAFARVLVIYKAAYPGLNYKTGVATGNLADTYLYRKDYRRAEPLYRQALSHFLASQGADHLNTGIGYIKLGRCLLRSGKFRAAETETTHGYAVVAKVASPGVSFLQAARLDLSIAYDSLHQPEKAAAFRAERERYLPKPGK